MDRDRIMEDVGGVFRAKGADTGLSSLETVVLGFLMHFGLARRWRHHYVPMRTFFCLDA